MVFIEAFNEYSTHLMTSPPTSVSTLSEKTFQKNSIDSKLDSINMLKSIIDRISKIREYPKNANSINNNANSNNIVINNLNNNFNINANNKAESNTNSDSSDSFESLLALAKKSVSISFKDYLLFQQQRQHQQQQQQHQTSTHSNIFHSMNVKNSNISLFEFKGYATLLFNSSLNLTMDLLSANTKSQAFNASLSHVLKFANYSVERSLALKSPVDAETLKSSNPIIHYKNSPLLIGLAFFYSILIITSLTSNPLLIYVLLWRRKAQIKLIDIFVANLSLSDLFLTLFNIPLSIILYFVGQWPFGSLLCQIGTYSTSCSIYVNIFTMAYISIDRYFAVTRPFISSSNQNCQLRKKSILLDDRMRRKIYLVLTLIWIIALILSLPQFLFSKVENNEMPSERDYATFDTKKPEDVTTTTTRFMHGYLNKNLHIFKLNNGLATN